MRSLLLMIFLSLVCAAPLRAQSSSPSQTAVRADDRLRLWLASDPRVRVRIDQAQSVVVPAEQPAPALFADPDMKDALADRPQSPAESRRQLLGRLPGLQAPRQMGCPDFTGCAVPPLALDIVPGESIEQAIRCLLRPWIWLADVRGIRLGVAPASADEKEGVIAMNLKELGLTDVSLNVKSRPEGGFHLWFSRGLELASLYDRERQTAFKR